MSANERAKGPLVAGYRRGGAGDGGADREGSAPELALGVSRATHDAARGTCQHRGGDDQNRFAMQTSQ